MSLATKVRQVIDGDNEVIS